MVQWLARTTQLLRRRQPPEPPAPFELTCGCGHNVSGLRQATYQTVTCNRCGNPLFVLPTDVYPKPKPKKSAKKTALPAAAPDHVRQVETAQPVPVPSTQAKGSGPAQVAGRAAPKAGSPAAVEREEPQPTAPATAAVRRPLVSRFRLIVMAIAGVITMTGYFVWQSRLNDRALVSLPGHLEAGAAALRAGNLRIAADEYRQAAWAVDRLGRDDAESAGIRQKARELDAIVNLSAVSLFDICEQARRAAPSGAAKWTEKFNRLYRDSWIVVEGDVIQDSGPDGVAQPMVRYPFPIDGAPTVFDARLTALGALSTKGGPPHVIFAGQLASLTKEGTKNPVWMIRLKDASAFLWADVDTYQALGFGPDSPDLGGPGLGGPGPDGAGDANDTRRILSQQAAALGIKP
jgi:hypothetical protein